MYGTRLYTNLLKISTVFDIESVLIEFRKKICQTPLNSCELWVGCLCDHILVLSFVWNRLGILSWYDMG